MRDAEEMHRAGAEIPRFGSLPVQEYRRKRQHGCGNTRGLSAWGRLCGTFLAYGEGYAAHAGTVQRGQFLAEPRTRRERAFTPVPSAVVLAAKTAAGMPVP